jgi:hypothetical protein
MRQLGPVLAALTIWTVLPLSPLQAQETLQVVGYQGSNATVRVYDREGNQLGKWPIGDLPPPPVPVLEANEDRGLYRIATAQGDVWVSGTNARLNRTAGVLSVCQQAERVENVNRTAKGHGSRSLVPCPEDQ